MLRRNVGIKVLLFNNRIYGLTKGQYSPTSEIGKKAKSTPYGSLDRPFNPLSLALGAEATFVARSVDVFQPHLKAVLKKAAAHPGSAFVEILQNCNIFNDGAWDNLTDKTLRDDHTIAVEHGKPLVFGKARDKGIRMSGLALEVVTLCNGLTESDLIVHDERNPNPAYAFLLSRMDATPGFPTPIGVLRSVEAPRYESLVAEQVRAVTEKKGRGDLGRLLRAGDTWEVR
jgi:2-oxoglutarate ferredoxin oxidoreductase subunit beta